MEKILSISIAAYNVEKYISKTLDSLIDEELKDIEVLIIVDGSKDRTLEIAQEYERKYPSIFKAVYKENGGYGSTINKGIELATGKYFKQLDGDDWYNTENLKKICNILRKIDTDIVYTPYIEYNEVENKQIISYNDIEKYSDIENLEDVIKYANKNITMHSLMYKTEILKNNNIKLEEHCFYTDTEYAIYPLIHSNTIKILNIPLYMYRIGIEGQSMSIQGRIKHYKEHIKINYKLFEQVNKNQDKSKQNLNEYLENFLSVLYSNFIGNFMMLLPSNKIHYEELKDFDNKIYRLDDNIYKKMETSSRMVKILRKGKYITYIICHYLKLIKFNMA